MKTTGPKVTKLENIIKQVMRFYILEKKKCPLKKVITRGGITLYSGPGILTLGKTQ